MTGESPVFYLLIAHRRQTIPFADLNGHAMIFLKHFDVDNQTLFGVTKHYISRTSKVGDLCGVICERMKWPPQTAVKLYEVRDSV